MKRFLFFIGMLLLLHSTSANAENPMSRCDKCHSVSGWGFATFDHSKTNFQLKGQHQSVRCKQCHAGGAYEKRTDQACSACHKDVHAGRLGVYCEKCHDESGWRGLFTVDSHRRTNFPLTGRHALIPCEECHTTVRDRTFTRAALECYACHEKDFASTATKGIDHVAFNFGTTCTQCHRPTRWKPASFAAHDVCFPISRGAHSGLTCTDCHSGTITGTISGSCSTGNTTCTGCHTGAHSQSKMDSEHQEVAGYQYKDGKCRECHHSGTTGN